MATATKRTATSSSSSSGSRIGKLLLWLILLVMVVAASIAGTFFIMQYMGIQGAPGFAEGAVPGVERQQIPLPAPISAPQDPFTLTLRVARTIRILYAAITRRLVDE